MRVLSFARLVRAAAFVAFSLFSLHDVSRARADSAEVKVGDVAIVEAWARATPVKTGAAYVTVRNDGATADRLIGASAEIAQMSHLCMS